MLLPYIGEYGRFQKILNVVFPIICIPSSYQILIVYFSTITPSWKCVNNSLDCTWNETLHPDDNRRCYMPRSEWYYTEHKGYSLVTQFDIHCNDSWLLNLVSCTLFIGWGFGGVILGWVGDQYGRKVVLTPSVIGILLLGFISAHLPNIYLIIACRFLIGFFVPGVQIQVFILLSELVGSQQRPIAVLLIYLANPLGWCILALKAYIIKDWKILSMVCTAPYVFTILFNKFIPESIHWLHLQGQNDKVMDIARKIAKWNNRNLPTCIELSAPDNILAKRTSTVDLFRTRTIAIKSLVQAVIWFATVTAYYGLHIAANDLGGSVFRDFAILSLSESPAIFLAIFVSTRYGRKRSALIPIFMGSLACLSIAVIPHNSVTIATIVLGILGNFSLAIAFSSIYLWSVEIYPLNIRNQGMGFLQAVSHAGSAASPWITKGLKPFGKWCPFLVLGTIGVIAAAMGVMLPETKEMSSVDLNDETKHDMELGVITNKHA